MAPAPALPLVELVDTEPAAEAPGLMPPVAGLPAAAVAVLGCDIAAPVGAAPLPAAAELAGVPELAGVDMPGAVAAVIAGFA
jgi:hypothetical protein